MAFHRLLLRCKDLSLQSIVGPRSGKLDRVAVQFGKMNTRGFEPGSSLWKPIVKKWFMKDTQLKSVLSRVNETLNILAVLFGKQCNALAVQRLRRTAQIIDFYTKLYDKQQLRQFVKRLGSQLARNKKDRPLFALFSAALFSWDQHGISDEEVQRCVCSALIILITDNKVIG